jgi:hypothetical protein
MIRFPVATLPISFGGHTAAAIVITAEIEIITPAEVQSISSVTFTRGTDMAQRGTPQLNAPDPAKAITSRPVRVDFNNGAPSVTLDMQDPSANFTCDDGVSGNVVPQGDVNAAGPGPAGSPFPFTAPSGTGVGLPDTQTVTGVPFTQV